MRLLSYGLKTYKIFQVGKRMQSDGFMSGFTLFEYYERGNTHNAEFAGKLFLFVGVHFTNFHLIAALFGKRLQYRRLCAAGTAPGRPKIHEHGKGGLGYFFFEILVCQFNHNFIISVTGYFHSKLCFVQRKHSRAVDVEQFFEFFDGQVFVGVMQIGLSSGERRSECDCTRQFFRISSAAGF